MNKTNVLTYLLFMFILPLPLFAYLDPGSGSMLFSAVVGIVATLFFVIKGVFFKIIDLPAYFSGVSRGKRAKHSIVFYSEGPQYWNIFLPVIKELNERNVKCTYLSSKENDPGLSCGFSNVDTKFIGEGNKAFFYLNTLSADVCIMTTP
ncbi:MAG TPA: CDP-glycerol--glycerophosphate glycerophosphotransferase, partial [bacterium]|nr:CDP-glycerol--glycerophosphate glycerophosphotransferase [bacterium]